MNRLSRRDALLRFGKVAAVLGGASAATALAFDRGGPGVVRPGAGQQTRDYRPDDPGPEGAPAELAIARGDTDAALLVRRAVEALGGMRRFVSNRDVVAIKPNIGWDRAPVHAANTNPFVVAELVRQCLDAGAARVVVTDASCNEPGRCFTRSGIWQAAYDAGAEVVLPTTHRFRNMRMGGEVLDEWPIYRPIIESDKVINVPVAKHHNLARFTGAMKNWYGLLGGRRNRLHQNIDVSIADLATFLRPTLTVLDATRVLVRNGPQGGNISDAKDLFTIVASTDQVAADAYGCGLIGVRREDLPYLRMGQERGLGTTSWETLRTVEV
ncbi:MAG: DUF362 domain-containing protein [Polyangiaceae bacterium]|nr:DUF362 domain-containing protein [Polyangiaceae bacterium]